MEEKIFKYQIGDKTYIQKPLVLGQIKQLQKTIEGISFPGEITIPNTIMLLKDRMPQVLAVVLIEEGKSPRDKDLEALASEIEFGITPEQTFEVVEHFFDCNPIASLFERLTGMITNITEKISQIGSKTLSVSSPEETLSDETKFSGDILQESASPILSSESGK